MKKYLEFIENPTGELYVAAVDELARSTGYHPYGNPVERILELVADEDFEAAREAMATLRLSPDGHMLAAFVARELADQKLFEAEQRLSAACIKGILDTGDGTKDRPYVVSVVSDENISLRVLEKEMTSQQLDRDGDRFLDVIETTDEEQLYFDISVPFANLRQRMSKNKKER